MFSLIQLKHLLLLCVLSTQIAAFYLPSVERWNDASALNVYPRDDSKYEEYPCTRQNCGPSCTGSGASKVSTHKRFWVPLIDGDNSTTGVSKRDLQKRVFDYTFKRRRETWPSQVDYYLPNQIPEVTVTSFSSPQDPQFSKVENEVFFAGDETEKTVAHAATFVDEHGNKLDEQFQWGTGGLHGCTMLTIVSKRAVWMAHFWEVAAFNDKDGFDTADDTSKFNQYVLGVLEGNAPKETMDYVDHLNWDNFNECDDDVQVFWMSPVEMSASGKPMGQTPKYKVKMEKVNDFLREKLNEPTINTLLYERLNYFSRANGEQGGPDIKYVNKQAYGMCAFQYDGAGSWRLFYQHSVYSNNPDLANPLVYQTSNEGKFGGYDQKYYRPILPLKSKIQKWQG